MALKKKATTPAGVATHQEFTDPALKMAVRIPSPPPLLDQIMRLLEMPNASMEDISLVIQTDAGLTASLYRMLAKPIYGLRRPPETVSQAISLVGLTTVAELVKGLTLEKPSMANPSSIPGSGIAPMTLPPMPQPSPGNNAPPAIFFPSTPSWPDCSWTAACRS